MSGQRTKGKRAAATEVERSFVDAGEVTLAVDRRGPRDAPTLLLVHGYPDAQGMWRLVAERLAADFDVASYDVRGAGDSTAPASWRDYGFEELVADAVAVIDAVAPDGRVHLVGHDWGSVQGWELLSDPRTTKRIASFTSISGPPLDHMAEWTRERLRRPTPSALRDLFAQGSRSFYFSALGIPGVAERAWPNRIAGRWRDFISRVEHARVDDGYPAPTLARDGANGAGIYRCNLFPELSRPKQRAPVQTPVQIVIPGSERYISPRCFDGIERRYPNVHRRLVEGGHWVPRTHPELLARWIAEHVEGAESGEPISVRRPIGQDRGRPLAGQVALVTGAGSGIGRATAKAFARAGAELIVVDLNAESAEATAAVISEHAEVESIPTDVSDADQMQALADRVAAAHGSADIVVNNAGIAVAGPFIDHRVEDWERVLDVNLWGVIHGCRLFGRQMVERGQGGQIVNTSSAAGFQPSRTLPAYATSKAAVLMLSECLRAEFSGYGIGVAAICPGIIATPITQAAHFVGRSELEEGELRDRTTSLYQRRNFTAEQVADDVVRAVVDDRAVVPISPEAKLTYAISRLSPGLLRAMAKIDATPG